MDFILNNINALVTAGITGILVLCADRVLLFILQTFYPQTWIRDMAKDINGKIESLKKKFPEVGKKLEGNVVADLKWSADYIENN